MTEQDLQTIRAIEAEIYKLPNGDQQICDAMIKHFRTQIEEKGIPALLAFALVGAELQAKNP